jgi:hypothetical protein
MASIFILILQMRKLRLKVHFQSDNVEEGQEWPSKAMSEVKRPDTAASVPRSMEIPGCGAKYILHFLIFRRMK